MQRGYITITHKSKNAFIKAHTLTHTLHWLYIDHNLSFRSSVTFIHLFIGLFIYLCIHYSLGWLSFYLPARFRGESGRTFIFWWEQSLIQNRPIPRSLPLSVCLFLSVHQTGSLAVCLCPSAQLSATVSPSVSVCLYFFCVFQSLSLSCMFLLLHL